MENHDLSNPNYERYLPVACPLCGRMRLLYIPATGETHCEKCEADANMIHNSSPLPEFRAVEIIDAADRLVHLFENRSNGTTWQEIDAAIAEYYAARGTY